MYSNEQNPPYDDYFYRGVYRLPDVDNPDCPRKPIYVGEYRTKTNTAASEIAIYTAERISTGSEHNILGFDIDENGEYKYSKHYTPTRVPADTKNYYVGNTPVVNFLRDTGKAVDEFKEIEVKKMDDPLYITRLTYGDDTITGAFGIGFNELVKVNDRSTGFKNKFRKTGVFITLDSFDWEKPEIITQDIGLHALRSEQENERYRY